MSDVAVTVIAEGMMQGRMFDLAQGVHGRYEEMLQYCITYAKCQFDSTPHKQACPLFVFIPEHVFKQYLAEDFEAQLASYKCWRISPYLQRAQTNPQKRKLDSILSCQRKSQVV